MKVTPEDLAKMSPERKRELLQLLEVKQARESLFDGLFPEQLAFLNDPAPYKVAVCSRRAGKTYGTARALVKAALEKPGSSSLYITKTRAAAKKIVWEELKTVAEPHGGKTNEADLALKFPNKSTVYLVGANDRAKIENYRGLALALVVIDEAQNLPPFIEELVEAVIAPALIDHNGQLALIGTPPPVAAGYFYDCWESPGWSRHYWTIENNPHIPNAMERIKAECLRKGLTLDDPIVQREWFGKWVMDTDNLVLSYEPERNDFDYLPPGNWRYVIGVDLGYEDADAVAVVAYADDNPNAYLVYEHLQPHQDIDKLGALLKPLIAQYDPEVVVWDAGALGKKIAVTVSARLGIPMQAADKSRKLEFLELLNDALRTGRFKARANSRFANDTRLVEWDRDKTTPDKRVISDRYHSDIMDAVLYATRHSGHWLYERPTAKPVPGTEEYVTELEERLEAQALEEYRLQQEFDDWLEGRDVW